MQYSSPVKLFSWDTAKNNWLKAERKVSFEQVVIQIAQGHVLDLVEHPNPRRHPGQRMFIVEIDGYAYLVPFVENKNDCVLKTIIPSRKATKKYLKK